MEVLEPVEVREMLLDIVKGIKNIYSKEESK